MAYVKTFRKKEAQSDFAIIPMFGDRDMNRDVYVSQVNGMFDDGYKQIVFTKNILSEICHEIGKYYRVCTIVYDDSESISYVTVLSIDCSNFISRFDKWTDIRRVEFSNYNDMTRIGTVVYPTGDINLIGDELGLCDIEQVIIPILDKWFNKNSI